MDAEKDCLECTKSELDLFSIPPTQTSFEEGIWDTIEPHPNYRENSTLRFDIPSTSTQYIDMPQTELHLKITLQQKKIGGTFEGLKSDSKKLSVVNNLLHSLFKQVQVSLNNENVENSNDSYAYRAYMENLLCNSLETKNTILRNEGWIKDELSFDITTDGDNSGFKKRADLLTENKQLHLAGRLHCDVFNINRYLLNSVKFAIVLTRSHESFYLIGEHEDISKFKIYIESACLKVRRINVSPSVMLSHALALQKTTAKYPLKRVVMRPIVIPYMSVSHTIPQIHVGTMPSRVVVAFVKTEQVAGAFKLNPFNFGNHLITEMTLKVGSRAIPYSSPLKMDFSNDDYVDGYLGLFKNISESPNDISYTDYKNGNCVFAFDLTPDLCNGEYFNIPKDGSLDLSMNFEKAINVSITGIFYLEFDNIIEISENRKITYDYKI
jgi:hypothetical protein